MKTLDFIQDKQERVLNDYGYEISNNRHIDCPICQKKKKLRLHWYNDQIRYICVCGTGSLFDFLISVTGKDFQRLASEIDKDFGNTPDLTPVTRDTTKKDKAIALFKSSELLDGSEAKDYLNSREIFSMPKGGVKYGYVFDHELKKQMGAMIALASNDFSEPRMMHITYLENGKKITNGKARKMHSLAPKGFDNSSESIAIKLFEAGDVLGIAEGIETSLSAFQIYKCPVWSVMNSSYMKKFRAPSGVKTLYIFADNDSNGTGLAAAFECGNRNILANNDIEKVRIRWPERCNDFNDLIREGDKVIEWQLSK